MSIFSLGDGDLEPGKTYTVQLKDGQQVSATAVSADTVAIQTKPKWMLPAALGAGALGLVGYFLLKGHK